MTASVYWIHLPEHTDMFTDGYIGVTTMAVSERFKRHLSASRCTGRRAVIQNAIIKHGEKLIVDTVLVASEDYCYWVENKLRPSCSIGWNLAIGGTSPGSGRKNSPEHVAKVAAALKGRKHPPERVSANSERMKKYLTFDRPWQHPYSDKSAWAAAEDIYSTTMISPHIGARSIAKLFNISRDTATKVLRFIRDGWSPMEDQLYTTWKFSLKED